MIITALGGRALTISIITLTPGPPNCFHNSGGGASGCCPYLDLVVTSVLQLSVTAAPLPGRPEPIIDAAPRRRLLCDVAVEAVGLARLLRRCTGLTWQKIVQVTLLYA